MNDEITLTLNSPITDEEWNAIMDVDFDHTDRIWFHTKHGKDVEFIKSSSAWHASCTDCPLYDHDRHRCPRFNKVIPTAILDAQQRWIPCSERLPECEQEVLICTERKVYVNKNSGSKWVLESVITPALYEDGTMLEVNSKWRWEDIEYAGWDEEEDCGIIPEGWWENRHFNPDDVYNNIVDRKVIAWMPLPEPYKEGET
jgi:hypothetical protein